MASKNISSLEGAQNMGVFEGKDCKISLGGTLPNQEEALDRACEAGGGNAMVDVVVYFKPAVCAFDDNCWTVKGTVVKTKDMFKQSKLFDDKLKAADSDYVRERLTSPSGQEYFAFKKKSAIELDYDKTHYDLIVRID